MAERKDLEETGSDGAAGPQTTPESPAKIEMKGDLPVVESPSISPAISDTSPEITIDPAIAEAIGRISVVPAVEAVPPSLPRFAVKARHKRYALLAASVTIAAALGVVIGAVTSGGFTTAPRIDVAALEQKLEAAFEKKLEADKAMQASIARLAKDTTALKANVEATNKFARTEVAKIDSKIGTTVSERLKQASAEITGSISAPQTVEPAASPAMAGPVPTPRPAPRIAAAQSRPLVRPPVVRGWSVHDARGGYVYVENYGDVYQIVPGALLPGLGPVQSIKRLDGRWMVTTPKGIIVSLRDRRFFE